jgi:hypothetical protein
MSYLKKKLLFEANKKLELRYIINKSLIKEDDVNYLDLATKKLNELGLSFDVNSYFSQKPINDSDYLCVPKLEDQKKGDILNKVGDWLDNNFENKKLIEVKLKELIKIIKTVGSNISNTNLSEQSGVDSIIFGGTPISKEDILEIGNDLIFLLVMSLVYPKPEDKITRNFCIK